MDSHDPRPTPAAPTPAPPPFPPPAPGLAPAATPASPPSAHPSPPPRPPAPPAGPPGDAQKPSVPDIDFDPVTLRARRDGWTAHKQRTFIRILSECGIVKVAADAVGMSERSAHRLAIRDDAQAFSDAWDVALTVAARRAVSNLFEYAVEGVVETVWRDGEPVWQKRRPSEKALFFLLQRMDPARFGPQPPPVVDRYRDPPDPLRDAIGVIDFMIEQLRDLPPEEGDEGDEGGEGDGPEEWQGR